MKRIDIIGSRVGCLTVISYAGGSKWNCRCDKCQTETPIFSRAIREQRNVQCPSCGIHFNKRHGLCNSPTWISWRAMINRCEHRSSPSYEDYGGRGICVCERWRHSFDNFLTDMGIRPAGKQLDRIDYNGDYEPSNCRWSTSMEQNQNRRDNKFVILNGDRLVCREAERRLGMIRGHLGKKMRRLKWPAVDLAKIDFSKPIREIVIRLQGENITLSN